MFEFITQIDYRILLFIQEHLRFDWLTGPLVAISHLGNSGWFWIALCILLLIPKRTRMMGVCGLLALAVGALITNVALKNIVARIRPYDQFGDLILLLERQSDFSFPSGHSCSSFAAACALCWSADNKNLRRLGSVSVVLAAAIAWSRLYVAVHFPSDVIAGILLGMLSAWIVCTIYKKIRKNNYHKKMVKLQNSPEKSEENVGEQQ
ncbi:MAG: phosphatase PAP2 family protein [Clostridia bacterium]|nr:phosphatase PAP2 family protein [Lachnospiraceae bacterium]NCC00101.1 phosphatase PAP2 family protein [Clostridia bacterium]NCD01636.1 phosphatase PAP2 family protein [Clostridia bacterium]